MVRRLKGKGYSSGRNTYSYVNQGRKPAHSEELTPERKQLSSVRGLGVEQTGLSWGLLLHI